MSMDSVKGNPTWAEAESIYQRWRNEEFDIDDAKASQIVLTHTVVRMDSLGKQTPVRSRNAELSDLWADAVTGWPVNRETAQWRDSANEVINVYGLIRTRNCLIAGISIRKELQDREHQISQMSEDIRTFREKADEFETKFRKANDALLDKDRELADCRKELEDIRGHDIKDHLEHGAGHIQSGVEPKEDEKHE